MEKHTHLVHTAKELITQQTCAGWVQTQLTDLKDTNLKIVIISLMRIKKQERLDEMPRRLSSKVIQTEKTTTIMVNYITRNPICNIRPTHYILPDIINNMLNYPSDAWQQHMETTYVEKYNKLHLNKKETPIHQKSVKQNISTTFRPCRKYQNTSHILLIHSINESFTGMMISTIKKNLSSRTILTDHQNKINAMINHGLTRIRKTQIRID